MQRHRLRLWIRGARRYIRRADGRGAYTGFDIAGDDDRQAVADPYTPMPNCPIAAEPASSQPAAYTVASGMFNVKLDRYDEASQVPCSTTLDDDLALSERGFAFNALRCSDPDKQRADLLYARSRDFFDHCTTRSRRHVALMHDYPCTSSPFSCGHDRVARLVLFGAGDIARLAHHYFTPDTEHEVVAFTVDAAYRSGERVSRPAARRGRGGEPPVPSSERARCSSR